MNNTNTKLSALLPLTPRAWVAVALLVIVGCFEVIKVFHVDHHHGTEIGICTESNETDACHRAIVHLDAETGCSHSQHFDKWVADCEICDALITTYLFEAAAEISTPVYFTKVNRNQAIPEKLFSVLITFPQLRGPPVWS